MKDYVFQHLKSWQHLAHHCLERRVFLFRLRPKAHYLQHIGVDCARNRINPRLLTACFYDESFLGYIKLIACRCHSGTMIRERFWQRYFLHIGLLFEKNRKHSGWTDARAPGKKKSRTAATMPPCRHRAEQGSSDFLGVRFSKFRFSGV